MSASKQSKFFREDKNLVRKFLPATIVIFSLMEACPAGRADYPGAEAPPVIAQARQSQNSNSTNVVAGDATIPAGSETQSSAAQRLADHLEKCQAAAQPAETAAAAGNLRGAIQMLENVLKDDNKNEVAHCDLANAAYRLGDYTRANTETNLALSLNKKYAPAYLQLADVKARLGDLSGSERALRAAAELDPTLAAGADNAVSKRLSLLRNGKGQAGSGRVNNLIEQARYKFENGEPAQAEQLLTEALKIDSGNSEAHNQIGRVYNSQCLYTQAVSEYMRSVQLDAKNVKAQINLGWLSTRLGLWKQSNAAFLRAWQLEPNNCEAATGYALASANLGDGEAAKERLHALALAHPEAAWPKVGMAMLLESQGRYDFARDQLAQALQTEPTNARARKEFASICLREASQSGEKKDWVEATTQYAELLKVAPNSTEGYVGYGTALSHIGDNAGALRALSRAVTLSPRDAGAQSALSLVLFSQGSLKAAAEHARYALQLDPHQSAARTVMVKINHK